MTPTEWDSPLLPADGERLYDSRAAQMLEDMTGLHAQKDARIAEWERRWQIQADACQAAELENIQLHDQVATLTDRLKAMEKGAGLSTRIAYDATFYPLAQPASEAVQVPDGWQLVPKQATSEMWKAIDAIGLPWSTEQWHAMLAAKPKPEKGA